VAAASGPTPRVVHDPQRSRFEVELDGALAWCAYERRDDVLRAHHTEVPREHRGRGVAAALVEALLDHARENGFKVEPACSYVAGYMDRHPQTASLRA
jgi:predicted GNAT family acetyltransferase